MPQSTPERRAKWKDSETAIEFLRERGYVLHEDWTWTTESNTQTDEELDAIAYLIEEYDFGGLYP